MLTYNHTWQRQAVTRRQACVAKAMTSNDWQWQAMTPTCALTYSPTCAHAHPSDPCTDLPAYLTACPPTCLSAYLLTYLLTCVCACLPTCLAPGLPTVLLAYLPTCLRTYPPACLQPYLAAAGSDTQAGLRGQGDGKQWLAMTSNDKQ